MKQESEQKEARAHDLSRRDFVRTIRDSAFLLVIPHVLGCRTEVPNAGESSYTLKFLSVAESETAEAIAARILPRDNLPGAREAGAVYFIDHMLATDYSNQQQLYREGIRELDQLSNKRFSRRFPNIEASEQDLLLGEIERGADWKESGAFFAAIRLHTIQGMFSDPKYFGNRNRVGWQIMDI